MDARCHAIPAPVKAIIAFQYDDGHILYFPGRPIPYECEISIEREVSPIGYDGDVFYEPPPSVMTFHIKMFSTAFEERRPPTWEDIPDPDVIENPRMIEGG